MSIYITLFLESYIPSYVICILFSIHQIMRNMSVGYSEENCFSFKYTSMQVLYSVLTKMYFVCIHYRYYPFTVFGFFTNFFASMKFEAIPAESCKQRVSLHEYLALNSCSFTQDLFLLCLSGNATLQDISHFDSQAFGQIHLIHNWNVFHKSMNSLVSKVTWSAYESLRISEK